jgi:hypothetical protein
MVVALVSLFVALGGTAVAQVLITTTQIKDGTIRGKDVAAKTITAKNLIQGKGSGLDADKLDGQSSEQLAAQPGPASTAVGLLTTRTANHNIGPGGMGDFVAQCAPGEKATGGGSSSFGAVLTLDSRPNTESSWASFVANVGDQPVALTVWVVCLR